MDNEKRAHDLAILYMQLEIKEGKLSATAPEDCKGFADEYKHLYDCFIEQFEDVYPPCAHGSLRSFSPARTLVLAESSELPPP